MYKLMQGLSSETEPLNAPQATHLQEPLDTGLSSGRQTLSLFTWWLVSDHATTSALPLSKAQVYTAAGTRQFSLMPKSFPSLIPLSKQALL